MEKSKKYESILIFGGIFAISPTYAMLKGIYDLNISDILVKIPACIFLWGMIIFSLYKLKIDDEKKDEYKFGIFYLGFSFAIPGTLAILQNIFLNINDRYIYLNLLIFAIGWGLVIYCFNMRVKDKR